MSHLADAFTFALQKQLLKMPQHLSANVLIFLLRKTGIDTITQLNDLITQGMAFYLLVQTCAIRLDATLSITMNLWNNKSL